MEVNLVKNQPTFNGTFQGVLKNSYSTHLYPKTAIPGCQYSDRLMLKTLPRIMSSKKYSSNIDVSLNNINNEKFIAFETAPKVAKRFLPKLLQLFKGNFINLNNPVFWNVLNHKKINLMRYELTKTDFDKMIDYFINPKLPSAILERQSEDKNIIKKTFTFESALRQKFRSENEQKWLNEFFNIENVLKN